jgi:hypothetical protein
MPRAKSSRKKKFRSLKGGNYTPPVAKLEFASNKDAHMNAVQNQAARGEINSAYNKMTGGNKDGIVVPEIPGASSLGQANVNKLVLANANATSLAKFDKVGGAKKRHGVKSKKRRKSRRKGKKTKRKTKRRRRKKKSSKKQKRR